MPPPVFRTRLASIVAASRPARLAVMPRALSTSQVDAVISERVGRLTGTIQNHAVLKHPFLDYLLRRSTIGFNLPQLEIFAANYAHGCNETIPLLALLTEAAARSRDKRSLPTLGRNLHEETGKGKVGQDHLSLIERSLSLHGRLFGAPNVQFHDTGSSPLLTDETRLYVDGLKQVPQKPYEYKLGVELADEYSSNQVMNVYYRTLFVPYRKQYSKEEWGEIARYWKLHLGGMEARHAQDLATNIRDHCTTAKQVDMVEEGIRHILGAQAVLLKGMLQVMQTAEDKAPIIKVDNPREFGPKEMNAFLAGQWAKIAPPIVKSHTGVMK